MPHVGQVDNLRADCESAQMLTFNRRGRATNPPQVDNLTHNFRSRGAGGLSYRSK
jgi:hypothetical protein